MTRRSILVWAISIFYFATGLWYLPTLYNLVAVTFNDFSTVALLVGPDEWISLIGGVTAPVLSSPAAYALFLLKRSSVAIFGALFVLGVIYIFTEHWQEIVNFSAVAISTAVFVLLLRAVLFLYVLHLSKKGVLS